MLPIVKINPRTGQEGPEGEQMYSFTFPSTSALDWGGWSMPRPGHLPREKTRYPLCMLPTPQISFSVVRIPGQFGHLNPPPHTHTHTHIPDDPESTVLVHCITIIQSKCLPVESQAYIFIPRFARGLGFKTPAKSGNPRIIDRFPPPKKENCSYFLRGFFSLHKHCAGMFFFPLSTYLRCGPKTCSLCRTTLILQSTERTEFYIFILGATPWIWETAKYEHAKNERWLFYQGLTANARFSAVHIPYNKACDLHHDVECWVTQPNPLNRPVNHLLSCYAETLSR